MTKRSLFFGGLALLALLVFAGCSNPSSSDPESSPVAGNPLVPRDAVYAGNFAQLVGLLNEIAADTNGVKNIVYADDFDDELTIPGGKTVYWYGSDDPLGADVIVEEGARLVVLDHTLTTSDDGKLLVKGKVDVYSDLVIGVSALDVADYYVTDSTIEARGTVIGTSRVAIGASGTLTLRDDDIANQTTPNRFTPVQAWAAAGQGDLTIADPLAAAYTVTYMLTGINPSAERWYTFTTSGGDIPSVIPVGAHVTTTAAISDTADHTLTVNGWLIAPNASLGSITKLTVSGDLDTDNAASRAAGSPEFVGWSEGYLEANNATLASATSINVLDRGEFVSSSTKIELPKEGAKINLGRSAIFDASGATNNSFENLTDLYIGPGAGAAIASTGLTFVSLRELTLQDGARLTAPGGAVTFLIEATPTTPPTKTKINLGLNTYYNVVVAPTAKVDMAITSNSSLTNGSTVTVNEGSTFTLAENTTLTVGTGAEVDFSGLITVTGQTPTTPPTTPEAAPVKINGAIVLNKGGKFTGPDVDKLAADQKTKGASFIAFGPEGKIVLNHGATSEVSGETVIGTTNAAFTWAALVEGVDDGAQIEMNQAGLVIRDVKGPRDAVVTINSDSAYILKEQSLTLDSGVTLVANTKRLSLFGGDGTANGAILKGSGKLVISSDATVANGVTTIVGGNSGWQAVGADVISFVYNSSKANIVTLTAVGQPAASAVTALRALGMGASITVAAGKELAIGDKTSVELGGIPTSAYGTIVLTAASSDGAKLSFAGTGATGSKLLLGAGTGGTALASISGNISIGSAKIENTSLVGADYLALASGHLVQLGGTTAGSIAANNTSGTSNAPLNVTLASTSVVSVTP